MPINSGRISPEDLEPGGSSAWVGAAAATRHAGAMGDEVMGAGATDGLAGPMPASLSVHGRTHGRRRGRPLRANRRRLFEEVLPRISFAAPEGETLDLGALFSRPHARLALEIGFGAGEHLAWQAGHDRDCGFIGVEFFENGVAALLSRVFADYPEDRAEQLNLRLHQGDARAVVEALPPASLDRMFILFPDPWPKPRHHKRRLISRRFLDAAARVLRDGAILRFASDDQSYISWTLERLVRHPDFHWFAMGPDDWRHDGARRPGDWPRTRYERKAIKAGKPAFLLSFKRLARWKVADRTVAAR